MTDVSDVTLLIPIHRDGRKDWLEHTLNSFSYHAPGVRFLVAENTGEVVESMNEALGMVETEYVLPFGSDDLCMAGYVQKLRETVATCDVAYPSMQLVSEEGLETVGFFHADPFCPHRLDRMNYISGSSMIRTASIRKVGGWRDIQLEDWDLWRRMLKAGFRFRSRPDAVLAYRQVTSRPRRNELTPEVIRKIMDGDEPTPVKATFYAQATPATTYWRCQVPASRLPAIVRQGAPASTDEDGSIRFVEHEGAAVWQFPGSMDRATAILTMRKGEGIRTLVEVDDNYLDTSDHIVRKRTGWGLKITEKAHTVQGHEWCVRNSDGVIVTTPYLADIYRKVNPNVYVCPNAIDPQDWPANLRKPNDGILRIGWFASLSHDRDEGLVRKALSWASRQPDVQVLTMGYGPPWTFEHRQLPWADDLRTYFKAMTALDIGVCPVDTTTWSSCRSDLKALEYGMAGALPVVSAAPPYDSLKEQPVMRCANAKQWQDAIRHLVKNRDEVKQLAGEFRRYVLEERTIDRRIEDWEAAISG